MVNIPRFNAQFGQIQIPSLNNFQEKQNEEITNAVANFANVTTKIATNLYVEDQKYKAEVKGAEDVESGKLTDLNSLPTPITVAQKSYNESVINAFNAKNAVDTTQQIITLADQNRDNPAQFLQLANSYIDGTSQNVPANLKATIVKPMEMQALSTYKTLLGNKIQRSREQSKAQTQISVDELIRQATNESDPEIQSQKIAEVTNVIWNAAGNGDMTGELATKKILEMRQGIASNKLSTQLLEKNYSAEQQQRLLVMAFNGKTGIKEFDSLSPEERQNAVKTAQERISYVKGWTANSAEQAQKYYIGRAVLDTYNKIQPNKELTGDIIKDISWGNQTYDHVFQEIQSNVFKDVPKQLEIDVSETIDNGTATEKDIINLYEQGYIDGNNVMDSLTQLYSPLSLNKKQPAYFTFKSNLEKELSDITNNIGFLTKKNLKKEYIESNMNNFLSSGEKTDSEIAEYSEIISEKASKKFNKENEYQSIHTPEWFKEKTGYNISAIENVVLESSISGQLDMKKLRALLLDITGNDQDQANKLYSYYMAVKNQ